MQQLLSRGIAFVLLVAAFALWPGEPASAAIPPGFMISNVPVDATADNIVAAKAAALAQGEVTAFHTLMQRLASDPDKVQTPDANTLTNLIADYQVTAEHSSAVHYVGTYTFRFNPHAIADYLEGQGVQFIEPPAKPMVIIPVLTIGSTSHLWDDPNPWRDAWSALGNQSGLVSTVLPAGDIQDVAGFDLPDTANPAPDRLTAFSARYGGGDVVVATAVESDQGGHAQLAITLTRYPGNGQPPQVSNAEVSGTTADATLYRSGVEAAMTALDSAWKNAPPPAPPAPDQTVELSAPVSDLAQWGEMRARLALIPIVHKVTIDYMTRSEVRMLVTYAGDMSALKAALGQQHLVVTDADPYPMLTLGSDIDSATLPPPAAAPPNPTPLATSPSAAGQD